MPQGDFAREIGAFGFAPEQAAIFLTGVVRVTVDEVTPAGQLTDHVVDITYFAEAIAPLAKELAAANVLDWVDFDLSVVRGLAYYTGMVFEVFEASGAERAIAGGGRYDNLVELFSGPSTPAVGFGMGDVVLSLVLQDKGLMPSDEELLRRAGHTPDVFVLPNGSAEAEIPCKQLVAQLRVLGIAARNTYKTTRNVGKLLQEASASKAPAAIIVEGPNLITLKALSGSAAGQQAQMPLQDLAPLLAALAQLGVRARV
jgi:histidyl-tRNA synthetase